jgi:Domain of unknown function (DUF4281)
MSSPWAAVLPLVSYAFAVAPHFGQLWAVVSRPESARAAGVPRAALRRHAIWGQLVAFDLFLGRWMYLEGRARGIHPLVVSPILLLTIFLSPVGLITFLAVHSGLAPRRTASLAT